MGLSPFTIIPGKSKKLASGRTIVTVVVQPFVTMRMEDLLICSSTRIPANAITVFSAFMLRTDASIR